MRVLLIDDDAEIRLAARYALGGLAGHEVIEAADTEAAVAAALAEPCDVVLVDLVLGDADGVAAALEVRRLPGYRDVPIVLLTGKDAAAAESARERTGALGVIAKPFDPFALPAHLQRLLAPEAEN